MVAALLLLLVRTGVLRERRCQDWSSEGSRKVRTRVLRGQGWSGLEF